MASGSKTMPQIDITPATNPSPGIHFHGQNGASANHFNNSSDFPSVAPGAALPAGGKAVSIKVTGTQGATVRFSNPS